MTNDVPAGDKPLFVTVGNNPARAFGMDAADRARALAIQAGLEPADGPRAGRSTLYADLNWAWDPQWLVALRDAPGSVLTKDGHPVFAHVPEDGDAGPALGAMQAAAPYEGSSLTAIDADTVDLSYGVLRKRDRPFVMPLDPADAEPVERAAY